MAIPITSQNSNPQIRIAAFGYRGVGKSTYLTALYAMLVNNSYRGVNYEYTDDDTAAKLSEYLNAVTENYSTSLDWQLPPTVALPQELRILLRRKGQEYNLNLIDYRGESTTIGEMTQNKDLLDFFATCDGLMIFNANEADETDLTARRANHLARHQDMKYLFSSLKKRAGQKKLRVPVAMVYTKSDKIDFGALTPEDWVEENNSALLDTFRDNVEVFQTVFLSSQMAFSNVMKDDRFRLTETDRIGSVVKCDSDVAHPLFWLLDQIQPPRPIQSPSIPALKSPSRWWAVAVAAILLACLGYFWQSNNITISSKIPLSTISSPNNPQEKPKSSKTVYAVSYVFNKKENRPSKIYLRQSASTQLDAIAAIDCGVAILSSGEPVVGQSVEGSNLWQPVIYNGVRGFIHSPFLIESVPNCPHQ